MPVIQSVPKTGDMRIKGHFFLLRKAQEGGEEKGEEGGDAQERQ